MAVGFEDYREGVLPGRTVIATGQVRYMGQDSASVTADGGTATLTVTPPAGFGATISGVLVTCTHSCIQDIEIEYAGDVLLKGKFDMSGWFPFPESGAFVTSAATAIIIRVTNNDSSDRTMGISIVGTLARY